MVHVHKHATEVCLEGMPVTRMVRLWRTGMQHVGSAPSTKPIANRRELGPIIFQTSLHPLYKGHLSVFGDR